jgi:hypothetical protein
MHVVDSPMHDVLLHHFPTWLTYRHPRLRLNAILALLSSLLIACHFSIQQVYKKI